MSLHGVVVGEGGNRDASMILASYRGANTEMNRTRSRDVTGKLRAHPSMFSNYSIVHIYNPPLGLLGVSLTSISIICCNTVSCFSIISLSRSISSNRICSPRPLT